MKNTNFPMTSALVFSTRLSYIVLHFTTDKLMPTSTIKSPICNNRFDTCCLLNLITPCQTYKSQHKLLIRRCNTRSVNSVSFIWILTTTGRSAINAYSGSSCHPNGSLCVWNARLHDVMMTMSVDDRMTRDSWENILVRSWCADNNLR